MPISAVDAISPSFQHAKQQLFQPFSFGQWAKLALVGFLAGELSSGGCNTHFQVPTHTDRTNSFLSPSLPNIDPAALAGMIALLIVAAFVFGILFLYVSSVMRFILFDSVIEKRCAIRRGWSRRQHAGFRFFLWHILFAIVMFGGLAFLIGVPAIIGFTQGWFNHPKDHLAPLILGGMFLFFVVFAFLVLTAVVHVLTKDFVVPQMALEDIGAIEGWKRLLPMLQSEKGGYAGYLGMKIVMALGAAVIVGIISFIVILVVLIPVGGMGAIAVLVGKAAGLQWDVFTITAAVVVGAVVFAVVFYLISLISVPAIVFFPAYSIYFFASRYPRLDALIHPQAPPQYQPPPPFTPPPAAIG